MPENNGARGPKLDEPLTLGKRYRVQWRRPGLNLAELAKFKNQGWSDESLAIHFGRNVETIKWWFRTFRREPRYKAHLKALEARNERS